MARKLWNASEMVALIVFMKYQMALFNKSICQKKVVGSNSASVILYRTVSYKNRVAHSIYITNSNLLGKKKPTNVTDVSVNLKAQ